MGESGCVEHVTESTQRTAHLVSSSPIIVQFDDGQLHLPLLEEAGPGQHW